MLTLTLTLALTLTLTRTLGKARVVQLFANGRHEQTIVCEKLS